MCTPETWRPLSNFFLLDLAEKGQTRQPKPPRQQVKSPPPTNAGVSKELRVQGLGKMFLNMILLNPMRQNMQYRKLQTQQRNRPPFTEGSSCKPKTTILKRTPTPPQKKQQQSSLYSPYSEEHAFTFFLGGGVGGWGLLCTYYQNPIELQHLQGKGLRFSAGLAE